MAGLWCKPSWMTFTCVCRGSWALARKVSAVYWVTACPEFAVVQAHVTAFATSWPSPGRDLETWITGASGQPEPRSFVAGLRRDWDAPTAGLTLSLEEVVRAVVTQLVQLAKELVVASRRR